MPRDLFAQNQEEGMTESPDAQTPKAGGPLEFTIHSSDTDQTTSQAPRRSKKAQGMATLRPYVQTLSIADLDSCERLENSCFPEEERCTREKVCISVFVQSIMSDATFSVVFVFVGGTVILLRMIFDFGCAPELRCIVYTSVAATT